MNNLTSTRLVANVPQLLALSSPSLQATLSDPGKNAFVVTELVRHGCRPIRWTASLSGEWAPAPARMPDSKGYRCGSRARLHSSTRSVAVAWPVQARTMSS